MSFGEGDLHEKVEKLETANGRLCEQVNEQQAKIDGLEKLVGELWQRASLTMPKDGRKAYAERIAELGLEVA